MGSLVQSQANSSGSPNFLIVSQLFVVRMLVVLGIFTLFVNISIVVPLERRATEVSSMRGEEPDFHHHNPEEASLQGHHRLSEIRVQQTQSTVIPPRMDDEQGQLHIRSIFSEAGVELTDEMMKQLPSWSQVQQVVGEHPYIYGLDKCEEFREKVPADERMLGSSGMFNTGTNLVTHLLKQNCQIPERRAKYGPKATREQWGMRWQVPWGKHTAVKYRLAHATEKAASINKEWILPVVTIRNPYSWFKSMCNNGYTARWDHGKRQNCPMLVKDDGSPNPCTVKFAANRTDKHDSIAHLWNDWYNEYVKDADFPFLVIRMEDIVFYAKETTTAVCECAGGKIRTDQAFKFVVQSAKADSKGHDVSTGIFEAWIKYSKPYEPQAGFTDVDFALSKQYLDSNLMESFGYKHPPPSGGGATTR